MVLLKLKSIHGILCKQRYFSPVVVTCMPCKTHKTQLHANLDKKGTEPAVDLSFSLPRYSLFFLKLLW
jgi:hypothetical protein